MGFVNAEEAVEKKYAERLNERKKNRKALRESLLRMCERLDSGLLNLGDEEVQSYVKEVDSKLKLLDYRALIQPNKDPQGKRRDKLPENFKLADPDFTHDVMREMQYRAKRIPEDGSEAATNTR